ncbi:MAG: GNAT family N-acetyltransferase [Prevotellaceae bacterium]|jgi:diamine N-acetyltransferase|nr:GNAT family N-acetyltransferase [Prevotellaceae bacterium]
MLENDNITLRAVEPDDLKRLYEWENDCALWRFGNTVTPYSKYALEEFVRNADKDIYTAKQLRLMIESKEDCATVGCVDLFDFDFFHRRVALGVLIDKRYRRRGFAAQTLSLISDYCFSFLNLHQVYCHVPADNYASLKLFRNADFEPAGVLKHWLSAADGYTDVLFLQKINPNK